MEIILKEYFLIPVLTRTYCTACFLTSLAVQLGIVTPFHLYYNPKLIVYHYQLWRLATSFTYLGKLGFNFFFYMLFVYRYFRMLEESSFHGRTGDFVYMLLLCGLTILTGGAFLNVIFLCQALTMAIVYLWCRRNPYIQLNFFGLIHFTAPYIPWILLAFSTLLDSRVTGNLLGICVGHLYYFLEDVFPRMSHGFRVLQTPSFLRAIFDEAGDDQSIDSLPGDEAPAVAFDRNLPQ